MADPSILDYFRDPNFLNHIINGNSAESAWPGQTPEQSTNVAGAPPMPPASVMGPSPNGGVDQPGLVPPPLSRPPLPPNSMAPQEPSFPLPPPAAPLDFTLPQGAQPPNPPLPPAMPAPPPGPPPSFNDRAAPVRSAIANGDFDPQGRNFTDFNLAPLQPPPMGARTGVPYTQSQVAAPNAKDPSQPDIVRTTRNGMSPSLDDAALARPAPAGQPIDIRPPAQRGGQDQRNGPDPRIERSRAFGNFIASLGKGLTAVGGLRPGTNGASAFAAGAGGALTGHTENERHNQDRDEKGLDRKERGRERDQTFDYQNRTLAANTKYHDDMVEQHRLDRGDRTEQHIADREERAGRERFTPVGQTPDGRMIYHDRNNGSREVVGENAVVPKGTDRSREALYNIKQRAYLQVHPGDHQGALDYANGIKKLDDRDIARYATDRAQRDATKLAETNNEFAKRTQAEKDNYVRQRIEFWKRAFPGGSNAQTPPNGTVRLDPDRTAPGPVAAPAPALPPPTPPPGPAPVPVRPPMAPPGPGITTRPANPALSQIPPPLPPGAVMPGPPATGPQPPPQPPRPPHVPAGAQYSAQKGKWYMRGANGQPIEVPAV